MIDGRPYPPWPGEDDTVVVEEMLRDLQSGQWYECREFVRKYVQVKAKNIPQDHWEDIVQEVMMRVHKFLPTFQHRCKLKTWLFDIVYSCVIDAYRKLTRPGLPTTSLDDPHDHVENESDTLISSTTQTVEDECIVRNELSRAIAALREYVSTHAHPLRNGQILDMVLLEGHSLENAARAVGCSAPVAGYIVRSAQRYVREKLGDKR